MFFPCVSLQALSAQQLNRTLICYFAAKFYEKSSNDRASSTGTPTRTNVNIILILISLQQCAVFFFFQREISQSCEYINWQMEHNSIHEKLTFSAFYYNKTHRLYFTKLFVQVLDVNLNFLIENYRF